MMSERLHMNDIVISLRRNADLDGRTLAEAVLSVAEIEITDVLSTGRRLVANVSDRDLARLRNVLGSCCLFYERAAGRVLHDQR
jgi:hypothetical protein